MDRDTAKELKEMFEEEYASLMDNLFKDIKIVQRDDCFECAKAVMYKQTVP